MGVAPGGRRGETGEGRAKSSDISTRPGAQNRHQEEEMDMDRQRPSGAPERALSLREEAV